MKFPWWLSILIGAAFYGLCTWLLPNMETQNAGLNRFFAAAPDLAPVLSIPFLLLGAKLLYDLPSADRNEKEDSEKGKPK
ncbi:hypothetical protein JWG39_05610 [Desulforhopalus vacuolatus]|uniref:hypothetical protein n=1 Tax=Desulforhopalus vacuolatus TaxID=40414 RepID=UPI0019633565|nr:hypothetical protein [Desulforhopalus vacuolatus]MBM9519298.1 hypothetical protein [Desulforhopalus vacuolatus]